MNRFAYIADLYLSSGFNINLVGDGGTGKTSLINHLMRQHTSTHRIAVTPILTPLKLQTSILDKLALKKKHQKQKTLLPSMMTTGLFLDNLHLAYLGNLSSSSLLEAIRYLICHQKITEPQRDWYESNLSFNFITTCTPDSYWRLPARVTKNMCLLPFFPPSDECLHQVFLHSLQPWLASSSFSALGNTNRIANVS